MARTARFAWNNLLWLSTVVITASTAATGYPANNAGSPARWLYWRSTTTTGNQTLDFDLGSAQSTQCFLMAKWKAHTSGGTIKVQTKLLLADPYTDQGTFTLSGAGPNSVLALWLSAAISMRYVRFLFTNTGGVSDYVEAGAVFAGLYFQPTHSIDKGYSMVPIDPSVERSAMGGQRSVIVRPMYTRVTDASLPAKPEADRIAITTMTYTVGLRRSLFFAIDPDDPSYFVWYGHFEAPPGAKHVSVQRWTFNFGFVEDVG